MRTFLNGIDISSEMRTALVLEISFEKPRLPRKLKKAYRKINPNLSLNEMLELKRHGWTPRRLYKTERIAIRANAYATKLREALIALGTAGKCTEEAMENLINNISNL